MLNELNQIETNLNVSNEFKTNLSFDSNSFAQLNLNEYSSDPFKSQILADKPSFT